MRIAVVCAAMVCLFGRGVQLGAVERHWPAKDVLVGVNYFAGWWEELPNKWHGRGLRADEPDWRPGRPDRIPLLGCGNDQATMDREIAAAADHGVDFFSILWYFAPPGSTDEPVAKKLDRGLENFLRSPNAGRLRFAIEYCNHREFAARNDEQWIACLTTWIAAMRHPSYLRVGGRRVFKVHDAEGFRRQCGGDWRLCRARLDALRAAARSAGLGEMLIGGGIMGGSEVKPGEPFASLWDFTNIYMDVPRVDRRDKEYPYARLAEGCHNARARHAADPLPFIPFVAAGWNPRPWWHSRGDEPHQVFFQFPTREEWLAELKAVRDDLDIHPGFGLPLPDGGRQKAFTIYAWNEFGEGGIVAPTQADRYMKLDAIQEVFPPSGDARR